MNPDLEEDLQRWEARTASLDEIEAFHPVRTSESSPSCMRALACSRRRQRRTPRPDGS
jgi:hypothetical protein